MLTHSRKIICLIWFFASICVCLANDERAENDMVRFLSENNYLQGMAEIVFLLDRSGSVGAADFEIEKGFVESFLTHIVVDVNASRVAVISYSDTAVRHIDYLKEPKSKCFLAQELHDVVYENSGATNIEAALEEARLVFQNARQNVNKVVVLISDGEATRGGDPVVTAEKLKTDGVQIFCIGVGRFIRTELESIASNVENVHMCKGFKEFKRLARKIRGDPHESAWSSQASQANMAANCDHLCDSIYKREPNDPGCCDHDAWCSCALRSGLHTCVCKPGFYGLSGLIGNCRACPRGTYKSKLEPASSCIPCPLEATTAEIASTKLSDCYCKEGYTGNPSNNIPCKKIQCPPLQKPARGYLQGFCDTSYGSTCIFFCEEGYELMHRLSEERTCQSNGQWSGKTAVCQEIQCSSLPHPKNGRVECDKGTFTVGKRCRFKCSYGYVMSGSQERECTLSKSWTGIETECIPIPCNLPPRISFGSFKGCELDQRPKPGDTCIYVCNQGFQLEGPRFLTCQGNGKLLDKYGTSTIPKCIDTTPPEIICPRSIQVETDKGKHTKNVHWEIPIPSDNSGENPELKTNPANIYPDQAFPIGVHKIEYIATDHANLTTSCIFYVEILDRERPVVLKCPERIEILTNDVQAPVFWEEPEFQDNSKTPVTIVYKTASSGTEFRQGSQTVAYYVSDKSGNQQKCEFEVIVSRNTCPYYPPPVNGALARDELPYGEMYQVFCNEKYDFTRKPAEWYICNIDSEWETYPPNEKVPWPDCARPSLPESVQTRLGLHYSGDCNDPAVQNYIKKLFLRNLHASVKTSVLCRQSGACSVKVSSVKVLCGQIVDLVHRRKRREVWQHAENEQLELEFEITINTEQEFNDTEAVLQDFLKTIKDLKWDSDEDLAITTTFAPNENSGKTGDVPLKITVAEEKTVLVCKPGSVQIEDLCVLCSSGTYYDSMTEECSECPIGYYQEHQGQLLCEKCPNGTLTEYPKSRNEASCKAICPLGTYSATGLETCLACPIGKYQNSAGMNSCYDCPNGTTTGDVGAKFIQDCEDTCPPGTFSENGLNWKPCKLCPLHEYNPLPGQTNCLECPDTLSTEEEGAIDLNQCLDIDPCSTHNPCLNSGSCSREGRNAKCLCRQGFDGIYCEKDVDECSFSPCSNGGQCINTEGSFACKCLDGFFGQLCEEEIDECAGAPCQNNGTCIDKVNGFTCVCSREYEGVHCEVQREICFRDVSCLNSGICMFGDNDNSSFCVCEPGFSGIDCSNNVNECENMTCENGGSCIDGINSFKCACPAGYTGMFCETDIDECENNFCQSGSSCEDLVGMYKCLCPPGWNGTYCEQKMDSDFILMFPESKTSIANMASLTLNSSLTDATISLWVQTNDTERSGTPLSYAVASTSTLTPDGTIIDNALTISDCSEVKIYINNEPVVTDLEIADGQWHHLAFTWSSENSGMWALYKDGELTQEGNNLRPNDVINGGGSMIIGQEQDTLAGGFSPIETFTGNITRVNIWNSYFSGSNITRLCNLDDDLPDKVIAWPDFLQGLQGSVQILKNVKPPVKAK